MNFISVLLVVLLSCFCGSALSGPRFYNERNVPSICGMEVNTANSGISFSDTNSTQSPANISFITNEPSSQFALKITDIAYTGFGATVPPIGYESQFMNIAGTEYDFYTLQNSDGVDISVAENVDISLRLAMKKGDLPAGTPKITVTLQSFCK